MTLCPPGAKTTIEWQYTGEEKQRIEGADDYSITPVYPFATLYNWEFEISKVISVSKSVFFSNPLGCGGINRLHHECNEGARRTNLLLDSNKKVSSVYAPIYKYRVDEFYQNLHPCAPTGATNNPANYCTFSKGYKKIELLCHGSFGNYSASPVWITAYYDNRPNLPGTLLQVPFGTEQPVIYNQSSNTYVGLIPGGYDWSYFRFIPPNPNNKPTSCLFSAFKNNQAVYQKTKTTCPIVTYFCGEQCPPGTCECEGGGIVCCYDTTTGKAVKSFAK